MLAVALGWDVVVIIVAGMTVLGALIYIVLTRDRSPGSFRAGFFFERHPHEHEDEEADDGDTNR